MSRYDHTEFGEKQEGVFEKSLPWAFGCHSPFPVSWDKRGKPGVQACGDPGLGGILNGTHFPAKAKLLS